MTIVYRTALTGTLAAFAIIAIAAGCAAPQAERAADGSRPPALETLLRRDPDAQASWNTETGDIEIFGRLGRLEAGTTARDFLVRLDVPRPVAGTDYDLVVDRERTDTAGWRHVTFRQEIDGLPVWGRRLTVHIDADGQVAAINGRYVPERVTVEPRVSVDAGDAVSAAAVDARRAPGTAEYPPLAEPELVVHEGGGVYRTAWTFVMKGTDADGGPAEWRYFVDALTGAVLERFNEVRTAAASGEGIDCDLATRPLNLFGQDDVFRMRDDTRSDRGGSEIHTRVGGGDFAEDDDGAWDETEFPVRDGDQAEVSIHYWLGEAYDRLFELTGREGWDDGGFRIEAFAHYPGENNAYWFPNDRRVAFGESQGSRFRAFGCANDVVAHEFMHGVVHYTAGFGNKRDANAMDESFADMLGVMVDRGDWFMGEGTFQGSGAHRDIANPGAAGHPDHYSDANGSAHDNSNITSHAFYLAAEGLRHTGDSGYRCDVSLGREVTFGHFYYALENFLQPDSTMPHLAIYVDYIAKTVLGVGREERADVFAEAFRRVGLGDAGRELACGQPWFWVVF